MSPPRTPIAVVVSSPSFVLLDVSWTVGRQDSSDVRYLRTATGSSSPSGPNAARMLGATSSFIRIDHPCSDSGVPFGTAAERQIQQSVFRRPSRCRGTVPVPLGLKGESVQMSRMPRCVSLKHWRQRDN
jgi:hypothetical protein